MTSLGVVVPCYMGGDITLKFIQDVLPFVNKLVLVDDKCPLKTGEKLLKRDFKNKVHVIFNSKNIGVGGSTKKGFSWLLKQDCDIILKMDADYQMYPQDIPKMCGPIIRKECDATKGNRFTNIEKLIKMPKIRLIGNTFLSYLCKLSTGYWEIFDPTNGFLAFNSNAVREIDWDKTDNRFFFETDVLFRCSLKNLIIKNVSIDANYSNNYSSLKPLNEIYPFLIKNIKLLFKRIIYQYYLLDFNVGSIELLLSILFGLSSFLFGITLLIKTQITNEYTSAGNSSLFTILSILSIQFFLSFIYYDCSIRILLSREGESKTAASYSSSYSKEEFKT